MGNTIGIEALLGHGEWIRALALDVLRDPDRAEDVVQDTWMAAIKHLEEVDDGPRLRAWLARVARNFARMSLRGETRRRQREERYAQREGSPSTSETLERIALQRKLADAVLALEPLDRDVVSLRYYEGLPPREIARRLGLSPTAVSSRLTRAKAGLRIELESRPEWRHGQWAVVALGWPARRGIGDWTTPATLTGGLAVKFMLKASALLLAALLLGFAVYQALPLSPEVEAEGALGVVAPNLPTPSRGVVAETEADKPDSPEMRSALAELQTGEEGPPIIADFKTGEVIVRVVRVEDGEPAPNIGLELHRWDHSDNWFHARRAMTNEVGLAHFRAVPPGEVTIYIQRLSEANTFGAESVVVVAGESFEVEFEVIPGDTVIGQVVDFAGRPVAGADIWLGDGTGMPHFGQIVAHSDEEGAFELRHVSSTQAVAARAPNHAPSMALMPLFHESDEGGPIEIELVLPDAGGAIEGVVVDVDGRPIADALVLIGNGVFGDIHRLDGVPVYDPPIVRMRSDNQGRFRAEGVAAERILVRARGLGTSVASREVEVSKGGMASVRLVLGSGATIAGRVRFDNGRQVIGARIELERDRDELHHSFAPVAEDGSFELEGAPVGPVTAIINIEDEQLSVQAELETLAGETTWWEPVFPTTGELRGRLTDESGEPLIGWFIRRSTAEEGVAEEMARGQTHTDDNGEFRFESCPFAAHELEAHAPGQWFKEPGTTLEGVTPSSDELSLIVPLSEVSQRKLRVRIVDGTGNAIAGAEMTLRGDALFLRLKSDSRGEFEARYLPAGELHLSVSAPGYESASFPSIASLAEEEERYLDPIALSPAEN